MIVTPRRRGRPHKSMDHSNSIFNSIIVLQIATIMNEVPYEGKLSLRNNPKARELMKESGAELEKLAIINEDEFYMRVTQLQIAHPDFGIIFPNPLELYHYIKFDAQTSRLRELLAEYQKENGTSNRRLSNQFTICREVEKMDDIGCFNDDLEEAEYEQFEKQQEKGTFAAIKGKKPSICSFDQKGFDLLETEQHEILNAHSDEIVNEQRTYQEQIELVISVV